MTGRRISRRVFLAWCCGLLAFSAQAASLQRVKLGKGNYVSLHHWSRRWGFTMDWDKAKRLVQVKSRWTKMTFNVNSKKASINGLLVWMCSSITEYRGALYISELDVEKTLEPILSPKKLPKGKRLRTIVIAAGHGGKDPGNTVNKEQEKEYTLLLAKALKQELVANGFKVVMTRETDKFVDLEPQAAIARRAKADLFLTVHYNAVADVSPNGIETFALTPEGAISTNGGSPSPGALGNKYDSSNMLLAYHVHKSMLAKSDFEDRGIRRARFMVLRQLRMPGILIEGGFMSNRSDAKKIFSATHRKGFARAIAEGVLNYRKLVEQK